MPPDSSPGRAPAQSRRPTRPRRSRARASRAARSDAGNLEREGDVRDRRPPGKEARLLEDEADAGIGPARPGGPRPRRCRPRRAAARRSPGGACSCRSRSGPTRAMTDRRSTSRSIPPSTGTVRPSTGKANCRPARRMAARRARRALWARGRARRTRAPRRRERARRVARGHVAVESTSGEVWVPAAGTEAAPDRRSARKDRRPGRLAPLAGNSPPLRAAAALLAELLPLLRAGPTPFGTGATVEPRRLPCGRADPPDGGSGSPCEEPGRLAAAPRSVHHGPFGLTG